MRADLGRIVAQTIVCRLAQQTVVMALIEIAGLVCAGFRHQGHHHRDAQGSQALPQVGNKLWVAGGIFWEDKLKIHVHTLVALALNCFYQGINQSVLSLTIGQNGVGKLVGEGAGGGEGGQVEPGAHPNGLGGGEQSGVV